MVDQYKTKRPSQRSVVQSLPSAFHPIGHELHQDWLALRGHLNQHAFDLDISESPRQFSGGFGNLNYLVMINGREWVLRRPPPGNIPPGANDMSREFTILKDLWKAFPLAPKAIHFCADTAVLGAPFLIMEYRPGLVIGGSLPEFRPVTEEERALLGRRIVDLLADLHSVDAGSVGLSNLGRPEGMLSRMVEGWEKRANLAYGADTPRGIARTAHWLRNRLPIQQPTRLLHSDFKLDNIILDPVSLEPRAVIDWDMGTRGDPMVDLATLLSYWSQAGDPQAMQQLAQMPTAQPGFPTRADVLDIYARRTGANLSSFEFYRVLAMFKLTVVFMQLHAKYLRGEVANEKYKTFGPLSTGLLDFTEAIASGALH
ncbi:MAG: phosphotransferase family protein [Polaromonas sp.]